MGDTSLPAPPLSSAPRGVLQLEEFLESVLRRSLHTVLLERNALRTTASDCHQLRLLLVEMRTLSRYHSFLVTNSAEPSPLMPGNVAAKAAPDEKMITGSSPGATSGTALQHIPPQRSTILVNLGQHMYTQGVIKDASTVHVHLGCGVVLPMSTEEADRFLAKRQQVLQEQALNKTREAMRLTYRIRVVTEAISGLNKQQVGLAGAFADSS